MADARAMAWESDPRPWRDEAARRAYGLHDVARVLFRRGRIVFWFALGVMTATLVAVLLHEPTHRVSATILVKKNVAQVPLSPKDVPVWVMDHLSEEDINTEIGILGSRLLVDQALQATGPVDAQDGADGGFARRVAATASAVAAWAAPLLPGAAREPPQGADAIAADAARALGDAVAEALDVSAVPKSNMISVELLWPEPRWALDFVTALVDGYQQRRSELYQPPGAAQFFARQTSAAEADLGRAEASLRDYLLQTGITLIEDAEDGDALEAEKRAALESQRRIEGQQQASEAEARGIESELEKIGAQILAEAGRVEADLERRLRTKSEQKREDTLREERELREQLLGLQQSREAVQARLGKIRALEDQLRVLLLRGNGADGAGSKALRGEVDRLYAELAQLGQLKRYDLNTGQDTSLDQALEQRIVETQVTLGRLAERRRAIEGELAALAAGPDPMPVPATHAAAAQQAAGAEAVWAAVAGTQAALARAGQLLGVPDHRSLAPVFQSLVERMVAAESRLSGVQSRAAVLHEQSAAAAQRLALLNQRAGRVRGLRRDLAREENAYERYREKSDIAAISAAMSREQLVNTSLAQPPRLDTDPVGPGRLTLLILGAVLALGGGIGLALLFEHLDQSLVTGARLEERLGLRHLASVMDGETEGPLEIGLSALGPPRLAAPPPLLIGQVRGAGEHP